MKKILVILLTAAMLMSTLTGCTKPEENKQRPTTGNQATNSVTMAIETKPNTLDPCFSTLNAEGAVFTNIYDSMYIADKDGQPYLRLAESYTVAEDGTYVEFVVKQNVKFHSGDELKMEDIEYSFERTKTSTQAYYVGAYTTFEAVDERTFRLHFLAPSAAGWDALCSYIALMYIYNKSYCEAKGYDATTNMLYDCDGTGAFMFDKADEATGNITLKAFKDGWCVPSLDEISFKIITGDAQLAFEAGEIDVCGYSKTQFENIKNLENVGNAYFPRNYTGFLYFNLAKVADKDVRLALAYAINRTDVATVATNGAGETAYNLANPKVQFYADCCEHYDTDIEKSKQMLAAAGYSAENPYQVTLLVFGGQQDWVDAAQIVKQNLEQSYVAVTIEQCPDTNAYFLGGYEIAIIGVSLTTSFTSYAMMFDNQSLNICNAPDDLAKELIEACYGSVDEETTHKAMQMVVDSMTYYPLYYMSTYTCWDSNLKMGDSLYVLEAALPCDVSWSK